jgi:hypothetical protein
MISEEAMSKLKFVIKRFKPNSKGVSEFPNDRLARLFDVTEDFVQAVREDLIGEDIVGENFVPELDSYYRQIEVLNNWHQFDEICEDEPLTFPEEGL